MKKAVKNNKVYTPQDYIQLVTGIIHPSSPATSPRSFIRNALKDCGMVKKSYNLSQIEKIIEDGVQVVLVDCSGSEQGECTPQHRWYEVKGPCDEETAPPSRPGKWVFVTV